MLEHPQMGFSSPHFADQLGIEIAETSASAVPVQNRPDIAYIAGIDGEKGQEHDQTARDNRQAAHRPRR